VEQRSRHSYSRSHLKSKRHKRPDLKIPRCLADCDFVSGQAKYLYAVLRSYAWWNKDWAYPGRKTLAKQLGVSKATVSKYIKELEKHKLIRIKRRFNNSSVYLFPNYGQKIGPLLKSKNLTLSINEKRLRVVSRGHLKLVPTVRDRPERRELAVLRKHGVAQ
jgi:Helix-turn-helix domain